MRQTFCGISVCVALAVPVAALCWCTSAAALEIAVRGVSDPAPERLAEALEGDDDLLRFSTPATPDATLGQAVADATRLALQRQGYADPAVSTVVENDAGHRRVVVEVTPGSRLTAREIQITGLSERLAAELEQWLTSPQPPSSATPRIVDAGNAAAVQWVNDQGRPVRMTPPLWAPGEPAALDPPFVDAVKRMVIRFLREEGHLQAADQLKKKSQMLCKIAVDPGERPDDVAGGEATLSLRFDQLPPVATLGKVAIKGSGGVSAADLRAFLQLEDGARITEADRRLWEEQLRQSGRFIRHAVTLEPLGAEDGSVKAVVDLVSYPKVTPLGESLSREETVMLRFREWLTAALEGNGIHARWQRPDGTPVASCLLSAEHGAVVMLASQQAGGAVAVTETGLGVFLGQQRGRFEMPLSAQGQAVVHAALSVRDTVDTETGDYRHDLSLAASFGSAASESEPAAVVTARIEPVACLALVHRKPSSGGETSDIRWNGDVLEIHSNGGMARFDEETGRLLEIKIDRLGLVTLEEAGDWGVQMAELREDSGSNAYRQHAPVSSTIQFFASGELGAFAGQVLALIGLDRKASEAARPWNGLVTAVAAAAADGGFTDIDGLVADYLASESHRDELPTIPSATGDQPPVDAIMAVLSKLSVKAWVWLDDTCGSEAWPTGLARLANAVLRQDGSASFQEVALFMGSDQAGPVAHLMAASAMPMKPLAASFAMRGQSRAEPAAFARECEPLLSVLKKAGLEQPMVATLRRLDEGQAQSLGEACFGNAEGFGSFVDELQSCPTDQAAEEAVPAALMAWWEASLGKTVSLALEQRGGGRIAGREPSEPRLQR